MSGRLGPGGLLYDYGQPFRKPLAMDRALPKRMVMDGAALRLALARLPPAARDEIRKMSREWEATPAAERPGVFDRCQARVNEILAGAVTLDTGEALRKLQDRNELRRLIPNLYRL